MARTTLDQKIAKLEAELKNARASKTKEGRKERNSQLISLGIFFERIYRGLDADGKAKMRETAENLDARNKGRVLAAFDRIESSLTVSSTDKEQ